MKTCDKCKEEKQIVEFAVDRRRETGYKNYCKICAYKMTQDWNRSPKGIAIRLWHKHIRRSVTRNHDQPDYTKDWLINYIMTHPDYDKLHAEYVSSGFDKYKCPSIDRLDDNVGYKKDNIRLVSFQENMTHCYDAGRKAEHCNTGWEKGCMRPHHAVVQLSKDGSFISRFISVNDAARSVTGACNSKIPMVCQGKRQTHAGFKWMYAEDYEHS